MRWLRAEIGAFSRQLRDEAVTEFHVPARAAAWLFVVPFAAGVVVGASRLSLPVFRFITAEDRLLEWLQVAGYASAAAFAVLVAQLLLLADRRLFAAVYLVMALGAFFIAGEEISWGQRIFGVETPEYLEDRNRQGEIGVHNISTIETAFNLGLLAIGLYGSLGAWALRRKAPRRDPVAVGLLVPPLFLTSFFLLVSTGSYGSLCPT